MGFAQWILADLGLLAGFRILGALGFGWVSAGFWLGFGHDQKREPKWLARNPYLDVALNFLFFQEVEWKRLRRSLQYTYRRVWL